LYDKYILTKMGKKKLENEIVFRKLTRKIKSLPGR
jgi:hypothetical protein